MNEQSKNKNSELRAVAQLIKMCERLTSDLVVRVTTYDDAIDALVEVFKKKGNTKIDNEKKFTEYVNRFLRDDQKNEQHIITAIYKAAANEYTHSKNKLESKGY